MARDVPTTGEAAGSTRIMARLGRAIELLSDPATLQERIDEFRARHNSDSTNVDLQAKVASEYFSLAHNAIANAANCTTILPLCPGHNCIYKL